MAGKTWEQMTQAEKIEDLRRDVKRLFTAANTIETKLSDLQSGTSGDLKKLAERVDQLANLMNEASKP